jgi:hypothetical protein
MLRACVLCVMALWSGCACETVEGGVVKTAGLYALLEAEATGDGQLTTRATLKMSPTSLTYVSLAEGDTLVATVGVQSKTMARRTLFGATWYEVTSSGDSAELPVKIALDRPADVSAPSSSVTLPAPFSITAPAAMTAFSRANQGEVNVAWDAPTRGDAVDVEASGSCIETVSAFRTGAGAADANVPRLRARSGSEAATCEVQVTVTKTRDGSVDPAYGKGGVFHARVIRKLTVVSTP